MKIYNPTPIDIIRVSIRKKGFKTEHLNIIEASSDQCLKRLKNILKEDVSPFTENKEPKTAIDIREAKGGKNGKSMSFSFYGISPLDVKNLIVKNL